MKTAQRPSSRLFALPEDLLRVILVLSTPTNLSCLAVVCKAAQAAVDVYRRENGGYDTDPLLHSLWYLHRISAAWACTVKATVAIGAAAAGPSLCFSGGVLGSGRPRTSADLPAAKHRQLRSVKINLPTTRDIADRIAAIRGRLPHCRLSFKVLLHSVYRANASTRRFPTKAVLTKACRDMNAAAPDNESWIEVRKSATSKGSSVCFWANSKTGRINAPDESVNIRRRDITVTVDAQASMSAADVTNVLTILTDSLTISRTDGAAVTGRVRFQVAPEQ